jgi:hypothetical protein
MINREWQNILEPEEGWEEGRTREKHRMAEHIRTTRGRLGGGAHAKPEWQNILELLEKGWDEGGIGRKPLSEHGSKQNALF